MSDLKLGQLVDASQQRDAFHVAVAPVVAMKTLFPGQSIGFCYAGETEKVTEVDHPIGIVDPFLKTRVMEGDRFLMWLFPNTVTDLRHSWQHPAFPDTSKKPVVGDRKIALPGSNIAPPQKSASQLFIESTAEEYGLDYSEFMEHVDNYVKTGNCAIEGGRWEGMGLYSNDEFWDHYERVTEKPVPQNERCSFFTCSC